jgi:parallel beta-helix repeat protein
MDSSNLADGKPIYYWTEKQDMIVPADAGWVALIDCMRITVENLNLAAGHEILLVLTTNSTVTGNTLTNSDECIYLFGSSNISVTENTIIDSYYGIHLKDSHYNYIDRNSLTLSDTAIYLEGSNENSILDNDVSNGSRGIELLTSSGNLLTGNIIVSNEEGIRIWGAIHWETIYDEEMNPIQNVPHLQSSSNNNISRNDIVENALGVLIRASSNNTFSLNNLLNNTQQVKLENPLAELPFAKLTDPADIERVAPANSWDDWQRGNYWSDYKERYPDATEVNSTGLWDTAYVLDERNIDHHPLVNPVVLSRQPNGNAFPPSWVVAAIAAVATFGVASAIYFTKSKKNQGLAGLIPVVDLRVFPCNRIRWIVKNDVQP